MKTSVVFVLLMSCVLLPGALLLGSGCSTSDDPTEPGGPGTDVPGEPYVIPPFRVLRHGIELYGVWRDGEAVLSVGGMGKAIFITDAGRFILPTGKDFTMFDTWLSESGLVYVVGNDLQNRHAVLRYADGLRYDEQLDGTDKPRAVHGDKASGRVHVIDEVSVWTGPTTRGWLKLETFNTVLADVVCLDNGPTFISAQAGIYSNEVPPIWSRVYDSFGDCQALDGLGSDKIMVLADNILVREGEGDFEVAFAPGVELTGVSWAAPDWAVAVGQAGMIASFDGAVWSLNQLDTPHDLRAVAAWKEDEERFALAVGANGSEYRYADGDWTGGYDSKLRWLDLMGPGSGLPLYGIRYGDLVKYTGEVEEMETPGDYELSDLYCTAEDSLWVVGKLNIDTFLLRYEAGTWHSSWLSSLNNAGDIWVADRENVFVACDDGTVYQSVPPGGGMVPVTVVQPVQDLHGIWGASAGSVYAVGDNGTISHYDGALWTVATSGTESHLRAVWGSSDTHVVAVGDGGTVRRWDGAAWLAMDPGIAADLTVVWTDGPGNIWVAAEDGSLARFTGGGWESVPSGMAPVDLRVLWGMGDELWIAGGAGMLLEYVDPADIPAMLAAP